MNCAIYARKSTEQNGVNDKAKSVTHQIAHRKLYAAKKGWTVSDEHIFVDDGISGAAFGRNPHPLRLGARSLLLSPLVALLRPVPENLTLVDGAQQHLSHGGRSTVGRVLHGLVPVNGVPNGIFKEVAQSLRFKIKGSARSVVKVR